MNDTDRGGDPPELSEDDLVAISAALAAGPEDWLSLGRELEDKAAATESIPLKIAGMAFVYDLCLAADARREQHGPFISTWSGPEGTFPVPPTEALPEVLAVWRSMFAQIDDPVLKSRLGDLLFVAEGPSAHAEGRSAAEALLELASASSWSGLLRAKALARSLEILSGLNDSERLTEATGKAALIAGELLEGEQPGPPFTVLRSLIALKADLRPEGLDELLDLATESFTEDHARESAFDLAAAAATNGERKRSMRRAQLQVRIDASARVEGFEKVVLLQRALEFAARYQFRAEARDLLAQQQAVRSENLDFESEEVEIQVPKAEIEEQIERTVGSAEDIFTALKRVGAFGPPGGSNWEIDEELDAIDKEFPLLGLFGRQFFGPASSVPTFIADDDESRRRGDRGQHRQRGSTFYGSVLIAPMLDACAAEHGRPGREELARHFATELIGESRGERLARALELYWDGEYDDSAHILVPRLESILRDVARHSGLVVSKPARPRTFAGVTSLNVLMPQLREVSGGTGWFDYLEALLCDPLALNLRNEIAHGLIERVDRTLAALLMHAACFLAGSLRFKQTPPE